MPHFREFRTASDCHPESSDEAESQTFAKWVSILGLVVFRHAYHRLAVVLAWKEFGADLTPWSPDPPLRSQQIS